MRLHLSLYTAAMANAASDTAIAAWARLVAVLDGMAGALRPLIQPIDTWFEARRLGLLFEARVNGGPVMVCSMDLQSRLQERLVARQMWFSLMRYLESEAFAPEVIVEAGLIEGIVEG